MARKITASNRSALIKRASKMPVGSPERKAILAGLSKKAGRPSAISRSKTAVTQDALGVYLMHWLEQACREVMVKRPKPMGKYGFKVIWGVDSGGRKLRAEAEVKWSKGKIIVTGLSSDFARVSNWRWLELDFKDIWEENPYYVGDRIYRAIAEGSGSRWLDDEDDDDYDWDAE